LTGEAERAPISLRLYAAAAAALAPVAPTWLARRVRLGKEDPRRWPERLGEAGVPRPAGRLAWLHGVSVGESLSLLPLVARLTEERPEVSVLVTSGTRASADLLGARLRGRALHQYAPLDTPAAVARFLDAWRPEIGVLVESELWPNLILAAKARGVRLALISARMSEKSAANWRRVPAAARTLLGAFDLILARDEAAARRFAGLGGQVAGLADLKFGAPPLPIDPAALTAARAATAGRSVVLAASTHPGEDALVLDAFRTAHDKGDGVLIIAPRHAERGGDIAALAAERGLAVSRRSIGGQPGDGAVHVADTVGELGLWYSLAGLAVVGGSLAPGIGGHNPLEPARLGCPFISGPHVRDWPVYGALEAAGATRLVPADQVSQWFARAITGSATLAPMAKRATAFAAAGDAAAGRTADHILGLLAP
jgi:3-deoxy-D-manno-octulosonic-acid transferase